MKILGFIDLLNDDHLAICGCDQFQLPGNRAAVGISEKLHHKGKENDGHDEVGCDDPCQGIEIGHQYVGKGQ